MRHGKTILILFLIVTSEHIFSQACCSIEVEYKGEIVNNSFSVQKISLPTTSLLAGLSNEKSDLSFIDIDRNNGGFDYITVSHQSTDFCTDQKTIIENFFKNKRAFIPILIWADGEREPIHLYVPIDMIHFSVSEPERIIVDFGKLTVKN